MFDLTNQTAVVTGGNRGISLGYARGLAKSGASVAIWSRSPERNQVAVDQLTALGADAFAAACDVTDPNSVNEALASTLEHFGAVHALFANAGTSGRMAFPDFDLEDWNDLFDVNVVGTLLPAQSVARHMIERGEGGSIAVTSSIGASHGLPVAPHYSASKAAQIGLVKALAVKLAKHNIRVNAICPGFVATELTEPEQTNEAFQTAIKQRVPLRRWGTPEDFEGLAVYLASGHSAFVTGAELVIDGGYSAF